MARARNIKPGFFTNDVLGELPPLCRLLFAGLWTVCDRAGRCEDRPKKIKAEVLPYDDCDADELLSLLETGGFIARYESSGVRVIQVLAWDKHQNPHVKEAASTLPAPDKHGASTVQAPDEEQPLPERAGLIPSSLIPDSGFSDSVASAMPAKTRGAKRCPESFEVTQDLAAWASASCPAVDLGAETAKFRDHTFQAAKSDWAATWRNWMRSAQERAPSARASPVADWAAKRREFADVLTGRKKSATTEPPLETIDGVTRILG